MASLFTPESERVRASQARAEKGGRNAGGPMRVPGTLGTLQGGKTGDSLDNPNSPGYEPWGKKQAAAAPENGTGLRTEGPAGTVIEPPSQGPEIIRLAFGWDRILFVQKKLCAKAKGIFTLLEGPEKYRAQKKGRVLQLKSRGCIVDLDLEETQEAKEAEEKRKKAEDLLK